MVEREVWAGGRDCDRRSRGREGLRRYGGRSGGSGEAREPGGARIPTRLLLLVEGRRPPPGDIVVPLHLRRGFVIR